MEALGERVVIRPVENKEIGKIVLVEDKDKVADRGIIVKVGDTELVKEGDEVIFKKYSESEIEIDGEKLLVVDVDDILVKLDK